MTSARTILTRRELSGQSLQGRAWHAAGDFRSALDEPPEPAATHRRRVLLVVGMVPPSSATPGADWQPDRKLGRGYTAGHQPAPPPTPRGLSEFGHLLNRTLELRNH